MGTNETRRTADNIIIINVIMHGHGEFGGRFGINEKRDVHHRKVERPGPHGAGVRVAAFWLVSSHDHNNNNKQVCAFQLASLVSGLGLSLARSLDVCGGGRRERIEVSSTWPGMISGAKAHDMMEGREGREEMPAQNPCMQSSLVV